MRKLPETRIQVWLPCQTAESPGSGGGYRFLFRLPPKSARLRNKTPPHNGGTTTSLTGAFRRTFHSPTVKLQPEARSIHKQAKRARQKPQLKTAILARHTGSCDAKNPPISNPAKGRQPSSPAITRPKSAESHESPSAAAVGMRLSHARSTAQSDPPAIPFWPRNSKTTSCWVAPTAEARGGDPSCGTRV